MDSAHWFIGVVFCGSAIVATMRCYQSRSGKLVVSLSWAWPHVPCHTLGSIRDHYEFDLTCIYPMLPWLPEYRLCHRRPVDCM